MKLAVILSLSTAAFAASIGSQKPILARQSYQDFGALLRQPGVSHCAEHQCKPADDKIQNECSKIVGDFESPENIDRELVLKYSFCLCDALASARADSPCGICLDEGSKSCIFLLRDVS